MNMEFGANKIPVGVIKQSAFGCSYFRDIYSSDCSGTRTK